MLAYRKIILFIFTLLVGIWFACEDVDYQLDNFSDPVNLDLTPPAIFFHPASKSIGVNDTFSLKLYSYDLPSVAAAHLQVLYDWKRLRVDSVITDTLFRIEVDPLLFVDTASAGTLDVFLFAIPTLSEENVLGTDAMARLFFYNKLPGITELSYGSGTKIVDAQNNPVEIISKGKATVDAK